jgi:hypothetical protein
MSNLFKTISLNRSTTIHPIGSLILCLGLSLAIISANAEQAIAASRALSKSSSYLSSFTPRKQQPAASTENEAIADATSGSQVLTAARSQPQEVVQVSEPLAIASPQLTAPEANASEQPERTVSLGVESHGVESHGVESHGVESQLSPRVESQLELGLRTASVESDRLNPSSISLSQDRLTGQRIPTPPSSVTQTIPLEPTETAQSTPSTIPSPAPEPRAQRNDRPDRNSGTSSAADLGTVTEPTLRVQGVYLLEGDEDSIRGRIYGVYPLSSRAQIGAVIDVTDDGVFNIFEEGGVDITELYIAVAPFEDLPGLRFVAGQLDLTSYFDRNSFAKDRATHFFNSVFQTNQALAAANINSRPGVLLNWTITDNVEVRAAGFSGDADIGDFELNSFAGELGLRFENFIVRGTYVSTEDSDSNTGFDEIFGIRRGDNRFGLLPGDKETAWGINAEYFIPEINMGIFGRYGRYENQELDRGADTFMAGISFLDLFMRNDRIGLGYGQALSNADLRDGDRPDVWELFYDAEVTRNLRVGVTLQGRDEFSETVAGFRVRADFDLLGDRRDDDEEDEDS